MSALDTQAIKEAAEAICGALHRLSYEFIGESDNGASTWFHRGVSPRDVRVEVVRSGLAPMVMVNTEYRNLHAPQELRRGRITQQIDVRGSSVDVFGATEKCVLRCLEIFRDVLEGSGVAGPDAWKPTPTQEISDMNVPETEDEERDEGL
jgi:hypothetical protein